MAKTKKHLSFYQRMDQEETFEPKTLQHSSQASPKATPGIAGRAGHKSQAARPGFKKKEAGKGCNCGLDMCKKCWLKK